jgi:hypothetical protein
LRSPPADAKKLPAKISSAPINAHGVLRTGAPLAQRDARRLAHHLSGNKRSRETGQPRPAARDKPFGASCALAAGALVSPWYAARGARATHF